MDLGDHQGLGRIEVGQKAYEAVRQHGLARAWTADHEEMMATCRGHLEGEAGDRLATYVGQFWSVLGVGRLGPELDQGRKGAVAGEPVNDLP